MLNYQLLQAYELLTLILSFNKDIFVSARHSMEKLAEKFDKHFSGNNFITAFEELSDSSPNQILIEDELFINFHNVNLKYTKLDVLSKKDRHTIYLCITGWLRQLEIDVIDTGLPARILSIDKEFVEIANVFFNDKVNDPFINGRNKMVILGPSTESIDNLEGHWVESNVPKELIEAGTFLFEGLKHPFKVLFIGDLKVFIITCTDCSARILRDGKQSLSGWELIDSGDTIYIEENIKIDYYDLKRRYLKNKFGEKLSLNVKDLSYAYSPGKGISKFDMEVEGGTFLGIMGKEGTGKSTILKLLSGEIISSHGEVTINGYSLKKELYHLKGMIGYVPEEDLLYDELTVFENLNNAARLYLGKLDEAALSFRVNQLLKDIDLIGIKNKVVGKVRDKNLQPGQRRLLNIAMELIREPQILIVDNAISPLSVVDSAKVIEVLSNYSFQGHIVITSITLTDNSSIRLFDNILIIDEGGFPVFYGKLNDAWNTFLDIFQSKNTGLIQLEPTSIVQYISQPFYSDEGEVIDRYKSPNELYSIYRERESSNKSQLYERKVLPENILSTPPLHRQYLIFNLRNFKMKIARSRELLYTVLLSPFLALVFSFFMRGGNAQTYRFSENPYIPKFFFISFLLSIFMGLVFSVNEIYREKNIIHKEAYLNISFFSYINSKITYLFIIILIQSFFFVSISHVVLQIKGMMLMHWMIFFSCQAFGMLLGLILSGSYRSIENLYMRAIPLVLLFQILFGGGFINFDSFPVNKKNTPVIADLAVTRWAYEAMLVHQYRENKYIKPLYLFNRNIVMGKTYSYHVIPVLRNRINYCIQYPVSVQDSMDLYCKSIRNTLVHIANRFDVFPYENIDRITPDNFNDELVGDLKDYLEYIDLYFYALYDQTLIDKEEYMMSVSDSLGKNYLNTIKSTYLNNYIESEVTQREKNQEVKFVGAILVMVSDPIYQYPLSDYGRGQFFVPEKKINGQLIDTVEFDISVIWLMNLFLYILLVFDIFNLTGIRMKSNIK